MRRVLLALALLMAVTPAWSARTYSRQSSTDADIISTTTVPWTAYPWTVQIHFKPDDTTTDMTLLSVAQKGSNTQWIISHLNAATDELQTACRAGGAAETANTTNTYTTGWHVATQVGTSATDRFIVLDGDTGSGVTSIGSCDPSGEDTFVIGARDVQNGELSGFNGELGQLCVWNVAFTDAEVAAAALDLPCDAVRPDALIRWVPQWGNQSPEVEWASGVEMTVEGTVDADEHHRLHWPGELFASWAPAPAAGAGMLFHLKEYHGLDGLGRGQ